MRKIYLRTGEDKANAVRAIMELESGRKWYVEIKKERIRRSLSQNGLMWRWIDIAASDLGYDKNDLHEVLKVACDCPAEKIVVDGKEYEVRSLSRLDTAEMANYMDRVFRKLSDMGIRLPLPEEAHIHA